MIVTYLIDVTPWRCTTSAPCESGYSCNGAEPTELDEIERLIDLACRRYWCSQPHFYLVEALERVRKLKRESAAALPAAGIDAVEVAPYFADEGTL